ncbi:hypothetical protein HPP92_012909 [Vanilla planifolia]|uniref:Uncharacterized protein n=1 Tax=Vanilla planifolia TaxID=51239 RepID=A0A835QY23_VANPL|nr:hypothetical protein HPP92_013364 [Vanilla planifolia]KAG0478190.1 hypothetical protein HPP92_012909 [Vanilla planifolia]
MLSIGVIYGHVRVQQDNLVERMRRREGEAKQKTKNKVVTTKIQPTGSTTLAAPDV